MPAIAGTIHDRKSLKNGAMPRRSVMSMITRRFTPANRILATAGCLAIGIAACGAAGTADAATVDTLSLKMDSQLTPSARSVGSNSAAVAFGASELRHQIRKVRNRVTTLEFERTEQQDALQARERLVADLERILAAQDGAIDVMTNHLERIQAPPMPASTVTVEATPPTPAASPTVPMAPMSAGISFDRLIIDGGLIGVIAVLLGWALYLRSRLSSGGEAGREASALLEPERPPPPIPAAMPSGPPPLAEVEELESVPPGPPPLAEVEEFESLPPGSPPLAEVEEIYEDPPAPGPAAQVDEPTTPSDELEEFGDFVMSVGEEDRADGFGADLITQRTLDASQTDFGPFSNDEVAATPEPEGSLDATSLDHPELQDLEPPADEFALLFEPGPAEPAAASADTAPASDETSDSGVDWSQTLIARTAADPNALREADTLIAFEDYEPAKRLLDELIRASPNNPEYRLRLVHVQAELGNKAEADQEEAILAAMMDGPLSETLHRVKEVGRDLLPGHRLFDDSFKRKADAPDLAVNSGKEEESILREIFPSSTDRDPSPPES